MFIGMQKDLAHERASTERALAKREKQLAKAVMTVAGMHGDMQGIIGTTMRTWRCQRRRRRRHSGHGGHVHRGWQARSGCRTVGRPTTST